ncbi:NUDIX hydrolase [Streptomyces sp. NPDC002004]
MSDVHRSIAHVMVLPQHPVDGRVLTVRHQHHSWHSPGLLTVVGGRLRANEFFDDGAARELAEETGIRIAPERLEFCLLVHLHAADGPIPLARPRTATPSPTRSCATSPPDSGTPS